MEQIYSFEDCYRILCIDSHCSWQDLRKSYRKLIQKWHPDRYIDESKKDIATQKFKEISLAFKNLSEYYQEKGFLPLEQDNTYSEPLQNRKPKINPDKNNKKQHNPINVSKEKTSNKKSLFIFGITSITLIILISKFVTLGISENEQLNKYDSDFTKKEPLTNDIKSNLDFNNQAPLIYDVKSNLDFNNQAEEVEQQESDTEEKNFTYGSSIGDVILIQGPPDEMKNDVWYYGKSEVHFRKGVVIYWVRSSEHRLKAQIPTHTKLQ